MTKRPRPRQPTLTGAALLAAVLLAAAAAPSASVATDQPTALQVQYRANPCTDGRYSDGRPRSCDELLDWLERRRGWDGPRHRTDPCTDGRYSYGRAMTCDELLERLDHDRYRGEGRRPPRW